MLCHRVLMSIWPQWLQLLDDHRVVMTAVTFQNGFKIHVDDILESWYGDPIYYRWMKRWWRDWVDNHDRDFNSHPKREVIVVFILSLLGEVLPEREAKDFLHCKHKSDWYASCYVDKWTYVASITWKEAQFCNAEVLLIVYSCMLWGWCLGEEVERCWSAG